MMALQQADYITLRLLKFSPFEQMPSGRWRYGTRSIADSVAQRLIVSGRAEIKGEQLIACQRPEEIA